MQRIVRQIEMQMCNNCQSYFSIKLLTNKQCKECLESSSTKQVVTEKEAQKQNIANEKAGY